MSAPIGNSSMTKSQLKRDLQSMLNNISKASSKAKKISDKLDIPSLSELEQVENNLKKLLENI